MTRFSQTVLDSSPSGEAYGRPVKVQKFGGTSVGSVTTLSAVVDIVRDTVGTHRPVIVVSALEGVTDLLVEACSRNGADSGQIEPLIDALWARHHLLASGLLLPAEMLQYERVLQSQIEYLVSTLSWLHGDHIDDDALRDEVLATGERISVPLTVLALRQSGIDAVGQDATELIRTDSTHEHAHVDLKATRRLVQDWFAGLRPTVVPVVTGFIGADASGAVTTLGRGGSDYTAALLASALTASILERWTDVDGLYTADPRTNDGARRLYHIFLDDALAWNQAGRLGMHRKALDPLVTAGIPTHVRSTRRPDRQGTFILPAGTRESATLTS